MSPMKSRYPPGIEDIINKSSRKPPTPHDAPDHPGYRNTCPDSLLAWIWPSSDRAAPDEMGRPPSPSPTTLSTEQGFERALWQVNKTRVQGMIGNVFRVHDSMSQILSTHSGCSTVILHLFGFKILTWRLLKLERMLRSMRAMCNSEKASRTDEEDTREQTDIQQILDTIKPGVDQVVQEGFLILDHWISGAAQIPESSSSMQILDRKVSTASSVGEVEAYQPPTTNWWAGQELCLAKQAHFRDSRSAPVTWSDWSREHELRLCGMRGRDAELDCRQKIRWEVRIVGTTGHLVALRRMVRNLVRELKQQQKEIGWKRS